jgi:hypothetical protein
MSALRGQTMDFVSFYRVAAILLVIICPIGGMLQQKSLGPKADAVFGSIKAVEFNFNGVTCTWYGLWFGFGLTASIFLLYWCRLAVHSGHDASCGWRMAKTVSKDSSCLFSEKNVKLGLLAGICWIGF